jgi:hypothetical protein
VLVRLIYRGLALALALALHALSAWPLTNLPD